MKISANRLWFENGQRDFVVLRGSKWVTLLQVATASKHRIRVKDFEALKPETPDHLKDLKQVAERLEKNAKIYGRESATVTKAVEMMNA